MIGVDSCERLVPSCNAHLTLNLETLPALTCVFALKRVLPVSPPYTPQSDALAT